MSEIAFQILNDVNFGFDASGSYVPPEPSGGVSFLTGTLFPLSSGTLSELTGLEMISGTMEMEEN